MYGDFVVNSKIAYDIKNAIDGAKRAQSLVAGSGRVVDEPGARNAIWVERLRSAARTTVRMEAGRYVYGVYDRGDRVCAQFRRSWQDSG
jgi:hypothetical protein